MNRAVNFSRSKAELSLLENELRHCVAQNSDENWDIRSYLVLEKFVENILSKNSFEISCLDITQSGAIAAAEQLRREYPKAMLMLIADASIAPTEYLRPGSGKFAFAEASECQERFQSLFGAVQLP